MQCENCLLKNIKAKNVYKKITLTFQNQNNASFELSSIYILLCIDCAKQLENFNNIWNILPIMQELLSFKYLKENEEDYLYGITTIELIKNQKEVINSK